MLDLRVASILVLMPFIIVTLWYGSPAFEVLAAFLTILMAWEWEMMVRGCFSISGAIIALGGVIAVVVSTYYPSIASIITGGVAAAVGLRSGNIWLTVGTVYIALPFISLVWLRTVNDIETIAWLFTVIWATDTTAYSVGKLVGGPRLAPGVSSGKTWSGTLGGVAVSIGVGVMIAVLLDFPSLWRSATASLILSIIAQIGDLLESKIKRCFGVKDSSYLIPGHGGIFDRLDSILIVAPVVAVIVWVTGSGTQF